MCTISLNLILCYFYSSVSSERNKQNVEERHATVIKKY